MIKLETRTSETTASAFGVPRGMKLLPVRVWRKEGMWRIRVWLYRSKRFIEAQSADLIQLLRVLVVGIRMKRKADEMTDRERLIRLLAEEGARRCVYAPGAGNPERWPESRCDCKYLGPFLGRPAECPPGCHEHTGCCEIRAAYVIVRDHS